VVLCFRLEIHIVSQFFTGYDGLDFETAHVKPSMDPSIWSITTWILEHWSVNGIYIYNYIYINIDVYRGFRGKGLPGWGHIT
jgi:hypothetical protein